MEQKIKMIPLAMIEPSPMNPRKTFDSEALQELADNILQHGLLQPITVRPIEANDKDPLGHFEIVCGERRYRAMKILAGDIGDAKIACIVREMSDEDALDAMITENLQRKDVDPIEEAFAFGQLHKNGKTIEEIALRFGKSKRFIAERIRLDNLIPELKEYVTKGYMHIGAALHIAKLDEEQQKEFYERFDEVDDEDDPIDKDDAVYYTSNLFREIRNAEWDKEFEGSCKTTCEKCPFNNANVGCLFYEMKNHDASCTNRERWDAKRKSWLFNIIEKNSDVLVREGEELEAGKAVVAYTHAPYSDEHNDELDEFCNEIRDMGYMVIPLGGVFDKYSFYDESDSRLQEKLAKNEVYKVVKVESGWRGISVDVRFYTFKKNPTGEEKEQAEAMKLVQEYNELVMKCITKKAEKKGAVLKDLDPSELSNEPLTDNEKTALMGILLRECSHVIRDRLNVIAYSSEPKVFKYAQEHPDEMNRIARDFIREKVDGSQVAWSSDLRECQTLIADEWVKDAVAEKETEIELRYKKAQDKIKDKLLHLGYGVDGKKLEF